ncbi:hypothetical protein OGAPHI_003353 [Ogataea philodendri]|uniref:Zn(2)-C6 fungal-type domain-containing protein n=1 Tax=Ogataea philodendri TaxID=1378263 RepID=A0A9P8T5E2_9ASCO|nr:uncharacterized protein OGAPHI_003353 [Ogataea philodendri]KAH3666903.1 hypothetical protein OGAPHI_003353 [Ogataea philodendri]
MEPAKRKKSFNGCFTCRRRKVACDLVKPHCGKCKKSGLVCDGYDVKLRWSPSVKFDKYGTQLPSGPSKETEYYQRRSIPFVTYPASQQYELYSELDDALAVLGRQEGLQEETMSQAVQIGPFGVFRGTSLGNEPASKRQKLEKDELGAGSENIGNLGNEWLSNELLDAALLTASALNGDTHFLDMFKTDAIDPIGEIEDTIQPAETVSNQMLHMLFQGRHTASPMEIPSSRENSHLIADSSTHLINIHAGKGAQMPKTIMEIVEAPPLPKSIDIDKFGLPTTSLTVHPMSRYLLNYYIENVADMMTVIPLPKNPWKFIYFPRAVMAVGELACVGHTSNAKNCLLNALLGISVFNLQSKFPRGSDEMKQYVDLGIQLRQQATNFLNKCLEEDILQQKYKDVLVAVLSMVTIDVVWGTMSGCKVHLDHCEKIIEKKMKVKKKLSSKAVILHRIFSSLKLIQDSTSLENISKKEIFLNRTNYSSFIIGSPVSKDEVQRYNSNNIIGIRKRRHNRERIPAALIGDDHEDSSSKGVYNEKITDNGKIRIEYIVNQHESEQPHESASPKSEVPAFIDITRSSFQPSKNKLDDKVISSDAIYGLPNSLILIFSEVVHLIRFKKYHRDQNSELPMFFDELSDQLEYKLLSWKLEWTLTVDEQGVQYISARHEGIYHHVMSFYHALVIYFYRFVEDVNPMYLQDRVEKVLNHLDQIQNIVEEHKNACYIIPLFWQGFVAGSEAMTVFLQNGYNLWGHKISQTGVGTYWNARQIMLEIWRRKNCNHQGDSWPDVLKDWKTNVMLT